MNALVVGAGSVGRWFGRTLRAADATVAFADADPAAAEAAADAVGGDAVTLEADDRYDAVCFAVPIPALEEAVAAGAHRAERAVCDLTGVMVPAVDALSAAAPDRQRLSLHPLFAPEHAPGTVAAVADSPGETTGAVRSALVAAGNEVFETTPETHDRAMETVQAKTHAAVLAFSLAAESVPGEFATPVYDHLLAAAEAVTGGDARVYADVQAAFEGADELAAAADRVADAARRVESDPAAFEDLYAEAGRPFDGGDRQ